MGLTGHTNNKAWMTRRYVIPQLPFTAETVIVGERLKGRFRILPVNIILHFNNESWVNVGNDVAVSCTRRATDRSRLCTNTIIIQNIQQFASTYSFVIKEL